MDDAMILPCGHSFGAGGMQHVIRMVSSQLKEFLVFEIIHCNIGGLNNFSY